MTTKYRFLVYYGHDQSLIPSLSLSELLICESRGWSDSDLLALRSQGAKIIGYISPFAWPDWMGPSKWWWGSKQRDPQWNAWWFNPASLGWRYQLSFMCKALKPRVDGLFFDNLDRLQVQPEALKSLLKLLRTIRKQWPEALLIGNRGFDHWDALKPYLDGVLFENLTDLAFTRNDKNWVESQLHRLGAHKVYALDYQTRRVEAEATRLQSLFPNMRYYCAPNENLQTLVE